MGSKKLKVFVLAHDEKLLPKVDPNSHLSVVDLSRLPIGEFQTEQLAENRIFLADIDLSDCDYVGLGSYRWSEKFPFIYSLEELAKLPLKPNIVWAPHVDPPGWLEIAEWGHPGMKNFLYSLEERLGLSFDSLDKFPSLYANTFICHKDVFLDLREHWRKWFKLVYEEYGFDYPYGILNPKAELRERKAGFLGERFTMSYFASKQDRLKVLQIPVIPTRYYFLNKLILNLRIRAAIS